MFQDLISWLIHNQNISGFIQLLQYQNHIVFFTVSEKPIWVRFFFKPHLGRSTLIIPYITHQGSSPLKCIYLGRNYLMKENLNSSKISGPFLKYFFGKLVLNNHLSSILVHQQDHSSPILVFLKFKINRKKENGKMWEKSE